MINFKSAELVTLISFYLLKALQLLFPLVSVYFIVHRISKELFGYIILAQSIAIFLSYIIEYGFSLSGTREISIALENEDEMSRIFSSVLWSKTLLTVPAVLMLILLFYTYHITSSFFFPTLILVIGLGFNTIWFFQGINNVRDISVADAVTKLIALFLIWSFAKGAHASEIYLLLIGLAQFLLGVFSSLYIFHMVKFQKCSFFEVKMRLKSSFALFLLRISSLIYSGGGTILLAGVVSPQILALYGAGDRVFRAASALTGPIGDAYFAPISRAEGTDLRLAGQLRLRASYLILAVAGLVFALLQFFGEWIIDRFFGSAYAESVGLLKILSLDLILIAIGTIIFILYLVPKKQDSSFTISTILAAIWAVFSILFLVPRFGIEWMAWTIVIAEVIIIATGVGFVVRLHVNNRSNNAGQ